MLKVKDGVKVSEVRFSFINPETGEIRQMPRMGAPLEQKDYSRLRYRAKKIAAENQYGPWDVEVEYTGEAGEDLGYETTRIDDFLRTSSTFLH